MSRMGQSPERVEYAPITGIIEARVKTQKARMRPNF